MSKVLTNWTASLAVIAVLASGAALLAQAQLLPLPRPNDPNAPRILAGPDLGFRIEGTDPRTGKPIGTLVVRINGEWVETGATLGIQRAK